MIPIDNVFMVNEDRIIDENLLDELETHNYSKVPVYAQHRSNIVGFFKLKELLVLKNSPTRSVKNSNLVHPIIKLNENLSLLDAIDQLK